MSLQGSLTPITLTHTLTLTLTHSLTHSLYQGNATAGIPRLRELIMTASKKPANPTMTLAISSKVRTRRVSTLVTKISKSIEISHPDV